MSVRLFTPPALATAAEIEDPLPTPDTAPSGCAAYCGTVAHCQRAIQNIDQRLRANPGLPLSLDLEGRLGGRLGHIELLQVHVDPSCEGEKPLTYVLDAHLLAHFIGTGLLRKILEDGGVPKVVHCSYGDASALFVEYHIYLRGAFDTGAADCVLRHTAQTGDREG